VKKFHVSFSLFSFVQLFGFFVFLFFFLCAIFPFDFLFSGCNPRVFADLVQGVEEAIFDGEKK